MVDEKKRVFEYKHITVLAHYFHIVLLLCLFLIGLTVAIFTNFPMKGTLVGLFGFAYTIIYWWIRLKRENDRPKFIVDEQGFEIVKNGTLSDYVRWEEVLKIKLLNHEQAEHGRPGFMVYYENSEIMVCEVIEGYVDFYNLFKEKSIKGTELELNPYDAKELNIYGGYKDRDF
jgi:hypothetical protein